MVYPAKRALNIRRAPLPRGGGARFCRAWQAIGTGLRARVIGCCARVIGCCARKVGRGVPEPKCRVSARSVAAPVGLRGIGRPGPGDTVRDEQRAEVAPVQGQSRDRAAIASADPRDPDRSALEEVARTCRSGLAALDLTRAFRLTGLCFRRIDTCDPDAFARRKADRVAVCHPCDYAACRRHRRQSRCPCCERKSK